MGEFRVHTFMVLVFIGVCGVLMLHDADGFGSIEVREELGSNKRNKSTVIYETTYPEEIR